MIALTKGELALSALLAGLALSGCYTGETRGDTLRKRAAFDMHCTKDELDVTRLDERTRGVRGCGHQATYIYVCQKPNNAFDQDCSWVMNSRGRADDDDDDSGSRRRRPAVAAHKPPRRQMDEDDQANQADQDDHPPRRRQADDDADQGAAPHQVQDSE
jgi:hypothetical protein